MRAFLCILISAVIVSLTCPVFSASESQPPVDPQYQIQTAPECWNLEEQTSFTGEVRVDQPEIEQRLSIYEIHDDDTVNPNHLLTGLPYYSTLTWGGSTDVEWLVLEGNFSSYSIDPVAHSVTFYDLRDWVHVVDPDEQLLHPTLSKPNPFLCHRAEWQPFVADRSTSALSCRLSDLICDSRWIYDARSW